MGVPGNGNRRVFTESGRLVRRWQYARRNGHRRARHGGADRDPGIGDVVFHSDRGSQYTGRAFRDACLSNGVIPSVGKTGICFDNAAAESWNATFKKEGIHLHAWKNLAHVRQAAFEYIEVYYNRKRIQKALGYLSPSEFESGIDMTMALVA